MEFKLHGIEASKRGNIICTNNRRPGYVSFLGYNKYKNAATWVDLTLEELEELVTVLQEVASNE